MGSKKPSGRMEIDNSLDHTVAEGGRKKFQHDFDEVSTNVCRWTHSEVRQMDLVGKYVRLFGGEHLFQGLYNQSCQHLPVFLSFSFVSCFELSEGRHHYPRQPLNEASKEIHSSFIIAMTSSDQHEGTQLSIFRVNTIVVFRSHDVRIFFIVI